MRKGWMSLWEHPFFGLTPEYKVRIHQEIFELSYFSEGAVNVSIAYDLPVHIRNFYYKQLANIKEREAKEIEQAGNKS